MEMFPVLKIAVGAELRGSGGGSFGTWVGRLTPFLFLLGPLRGSAPWIESIETSALTAPPQTEEEARKWGEDWPAGWGPGRRSQMASCVYQGGAGQARFSLPAFGSAQGLGTPGADVVRLPGCRPAGEESPLSLP